MSRPYSSADGRRFQRAIQEYRALAGSPGRYTMAAAFDQPSFSIVDYCASLTPNPAAPVAEEWVRVFADRHDLWLPGITEHCHTLTAYLYPHASVDRLSIIGKNFAIDWYLNDTIGREHITHLAPAAKEASVMLREQLIQASRTMRAGRHAQPVELVLHRVNNSDVVRCCHAVAGVGGQ